MSGKIRKFQYKFRMFTKKENGHEGYRCCNEGESCGQTGIQMKRTIHIAKILLQLTLYFAEPKDCKDRWLHQFQFWTLMDVPKGVKCWKTLHDVLKSGRRCAKGDRCCIENTSHK